MEDRTATRRPRGSDSAREESGGIPSDEALVRRYAACGDERAFVALMGRRAQRIRRLLFGLLNGNREDIQDVEQEILASLWVDLRSFRFGSSLDTYLYRFAHNKAVDFIRKQARQRRVATAVGQRNATPEEVHEEWHERQDRESAAAGILARLNEGERLLLTLKELEGLQIREIAEVLGIAEGTVKSRLHRIRRRISTMVGGEWP